jgi:hypothetical protein
MLTELLTRHEKENEILKKDLMELFKSNPNNIFNENIYDLVHEMFIEKHPDLSNNYVMKIDNSSEDEREIEFFVSYDNIARSFVISLKREIS